MILSQFLEHFTACRFSNIRCSNPNTFLEYHYGLCSAIASEVVLKLNIWDTKYGTKDSVESLLGNWNVSLKYVCHTLTIILLPHLSLIQACVCPYLKMLQ